jgi:hypothetical protein
MNGPDEYDPGKPPAPAGENVRYDLAGNVLPPLEDAQPPPVQQQQASVGYYDATRSTPTPTPPTPYGKPAGSFLQRHLSILPELLRQYDLPDSLAAMGTAVVTGGCWMIGVAAITLVSLWIPIPFRGCAAINSILYLSGMTGNFVCALVTLALGVLGYLGIKRRYTLAFLTGVIAYGLDIVYTALTNLLAFNLLWLLLETGCHVMIFQQILNGYGALKAIEQAGGSHVGRPGGWNG